MRVGLGLESSRKYHMQAGPGLSRVFKWLCDAAARLTLPHALLSILLYLRYDVFGNSCEWSRLRPFKPSSGSHQEFGQRPWIAAGARDWNCISIVTLNVDKHFYRTTLGSTGLVLREAYANTCLLVRSL